MCDNEVSSLTTCGKVQFTDVISIRCMEVCLAALPAKAIQFNIRTRVTDSCSIYGSLAAQFVVLLIFF